MLTRFVRNQLIIFTIASVIGVAMMLFGYMQVPTLLGLGRISVTLELPSTGGLYRFGNVTYNGVQIGRVTSVALTDQGAEATLMLNDSPKVPADLEAEVRSISAVGEQYVDLRPRADVPPYLHDGSVISLQDSVIPQAVGPMLDQVSSLVDSIPKDRLGNMLDESFQAVNGMGDNFGSLLDSAQTLTRDTNSVAEQTRSLVDDSGPLLDSQVRTTDAIRTWAHRLAGITGQVAANDSQIRTLLHDGPDFAGEVSRLLNQVKPTLPVLLANLTTLGQVAVTYNPSLEQLLVLLPPYIAAQQTYGLTTHQPTGVPIGDFSLQVGDPPPCTAGFLPPSQWRNPADTTEVDTPDGLYCKLPQDSPIGVRGARNYPCMGQPGKRAPTVEICDSDKPFEPVAVRQHALGPVPFDPNLVAQGVPLDDRATLQDFLFGPLQGTPRPAGGGPTLGASSVGAGPMPAQASLPADGALPPDSPMPALLAPASGSPGAPGLVPTGPPPGPAATEMEPSQASAAPSAFSGSTSGPSLAVARYDPSTGQYVGGDGRVYRQSNLVHPASAKTWTDLMPT